VSKFLLKQYKDSFLGDKLCILINKLELFSSWCVIVTLCWRSQVEKWWEDYAYLMNRMPHAPFVNFSGPSPYSRIAWPPLKGIHLEKGMHLERAALVTWYTLQFWNILRKYVGEQMSCQFHPKLTFNLCYIAVLTTWLKWLGKEIWVLLQLLCLLIQFLIQAISNWTQSAVEV